MIQLKIIKVFEKNYNYNTIIVEADNTDKKAHCLIYKGVWLEVDNDVLLLGKQRMTKNKIFISYPGLMIFENEKGIERTVICKAGSMEKRIKFKGNYAILK